MLALPPESPLQLSEVVFELNRDSLLGPRGSRLMSPVDKVMFPLIVRDGAWQAEEIAFVGERVKNGAGCTVVDIGANIGLFSRQLLHALPDLDRCLCVEPDPRNFEALKFNLEGYASKVSLFPHALGDKAGESVFFRDLENMGNYSLNRDAMRDRPFAEGRVKVVSASKWLSKALADAPRVIWKSDTQGHDEAIIAATPWEIWDKVEAAVVELWRIEKPDYDRQAFRERIASFPHRRIGKTWTASVDEVEIFLLGKDWVHDDLYLWR
jgi:FkbM family methyltransferase